MQFEVAPVSSGPRTILYFSAPDLSTGPAGAPAPGGAPRAPPPPPPAPYTPDRSGFPSGNLGAGFFAASARAADATAVVPATVTVTVFVNTWLFAPRTFIVYVVVAAGFNWRLPRGVTRPGSGSMVTPEGFSVCQMRLNVWPGLIDAGSAVNDMMRAWISLALPYADPSKPAPTAPGARGDGSLAGA